MKRLENKVAIITGAASIGQTTAKLFLDEGSRVMLVDLDESTLKKVAEEFGNENVSHSAADVTKSSDVQKYVSETVKVFRKIHVFSTTQESKAL